MKRSQNSKIGSSLVWASLVLCIGCIAYLIWKQWLFLMGGVVGFALLFTSKG